MYFFSKTPATARCTICMWDGATPVLSRSSKKEFHTPRRPVLNLFLMFSRHNERHHLFGSQLLRWSSRYWWCRSRRIREGGCFLRPPSEVVREVVLLVFCQSFCNGKGYLQQLFLNSTHNPWWVSTLLPNPLPLHKRGFWLKLKQNQTKPGQNKFNTNTHSRTYSPVNTSNKLAHSLSITEWCWLPPPSAHSPSVISTGSCFVLFYMYRRSWFLRHLPLLSFTVTFVVLTVLLQQMQWLLDSRSLTTRLHMIDFVMMIITILLRTRLHMIYQTIRHCLLSHHRHPLIRLHFFSV